MKNRKKFNYRLLGGAAQVGGNSTFFQIDDENILIDYGVLFPENNFFGINSIAPSIPSDLPRIDHLLLTHGHEDHIGAIEYLLRRFPLVNIYCSKFTYELLKQKISSPLSKNILLFEHLKPFNIGQIEITPLETEHSIPETFFFLIRPRQEKSILLYATDFKINIKNNRPDLKKINALTKNFKKRYLFVDSTNIFGTGKTGLEIDLAAPLEKEIEEHDGRIFITLFSSNIERIKTIAKIAVKLKIPLFSVGRSLQKYIQTYNSIYHDPCLEKIKDIDSFKIPNSKKSIVFLTGCQGEIRGALKRISKDEDKSVKLTPNDLIIFSSKAIPGNEVNIIKILNDLVKFGCRVINPFETPYHVSGHPGQEDLRYLYDAFNPTDVIPIHGEKFFLKKHLDFIQKNYPNAHSHYLENGQCLYTKNSNDDHTLDFLDSKLNIINKNIISERKKLAFSGVLSISIKLSTRKISLSSYGVNWDEELEQRAFLNYLDKFVKKNFKSNFTVMQEDIRVEMRRYLKQNLGERPYVIVHLDL